MPVQFLSFYLAGALIMESTCPVYTFSKHMHYHYGTYMIWCRSISMWIITHAKRIIIFDNTNIVLNSLYNHDLISLLSNRWIQDVSYTLWYFCCILNSLWFQLKVNNTSHNYVHVVIMESCTIFKIWYIDLLLPAMCAISMHFFKICIIPLSCQIVVYNTSNRFLHC